MTTTEISTALMDVIESITCHAKNNVLALKNQEMNANCERILINENDFSIEVGSKLLSIVDKLIDSMEK